MSKMEKEKFWRWGDIDHRFDPNSARAFIETVTKELNLEQVPKKQELKTATELPESLLSAPFVKKWLPKGLSIDSLDCFSHATGKSYRDLLRIRLGKLPRHPDGVLFLQKEGDLEELFKEAAREKITLIPFGGGTGVVGGTESLGPSDQPILVVDLKRLNRLLSLDETSLTATFESGILGPALEEILNDKGYTLGHFPQSFEFSTLGGWAVTRSAGQNSTKYGKIEQMVESLKIITPQGVLETRAVPASASGPELKELLIGSEGVYGIVTEVTVKIWRKPEAERFVTAFFDDFYDGVDCIRYLMQAGLKPSVIRLSDSSETDLLIKMKEWKWWKKFFFSLWCRLKRLGPGRSFLLIATEGSKEEVCHQASQIRSFVKKIGGVFAPGSAGEHWKQNRFELPYLRDDLMDHGFFIDTLETAVKWSQLGSLYQALGRSFQETDPKLLLGVHLSHAYRDGASLYFTFIGRQKEGEEIKQWEEIKRLATETLLKEGGTLSHHHGIGADHRQWMEEEKSSLGLDLLRGIKKKLDPSHLLNPDKLL